MGKPLIECLKERDWKSKEVYLSYAGTTTIEEIKTANEVVVVFKDNKEGSPVDVFGNIYVCRPMSQMWVNNYMFSDLYNVFRKMCCYVDFDTGVVTNGRDSSTDLQIFKVCWR